MTGHTFAVDSYGVCAGCHGSAANASNLVVFVSGVYHEPDTGAARLL